MLLIWGPVEQCCSITQNKDHHFQLIQLMTYYCNDTKRIFFLTKLSLNCKPGRTKHKNESLKRWGVFNNDLKPGRRAKRGNETYPQTQIHTHTYVYIWI